MKIAVPLWCGVIVVFCAVTFAAGEDAPTSVLRSSVAPSRSAPVTYEVDFSAVVTPPYHAKVLKVWLPIPQSDAGQEVTSGEITSFPLDVKPRIGQEEKFGNKFAYFEFSHPEGGQIVRHKFNITVWEQRWNINPEKIESPRMWTSEFDKYRQSESQAVVINDQVSKLARELVAQPQNPFRDLSAVMDWAQQNLKYDHNHASLQANSIHMLEDHAGHCSDYHGLCAALGRSLGYPTRVAYGINPMPKNSPSHCKLEAYLPPYGWVNFDVSETQKLFAKIAKDEKLPEEDKTLLTAAAKQRFLSGFRDNTWYKQTHGTDYDLAPPAAKKVAVVRTIYAEADGEALPEPDPANTTQRTFSWMTVHKYTPDHEVPYPFTDYTGLQEK